MIQKLVQDLKRTEKQLEDAEERVRQQDEIFRWDDMVAHNAERDYDNVRDRLATAEAELTDLRNAREGYNPWIWHENYSLKSQLQIKKLKWKGKRQAAEVLLEEVRDVRNKYMAEAERVWDLGEEVFKRVKKLEVKLHRNDDLMERAEEEFGDGSDDEDSKSDESNIDTQDGVRCQGNSQVGSSTQAPIGSQRTSSSKCQPSHPHKATLSAPNCCLDEIFAMIPNRAPAFTSPFYADEGSRITSTYLEVRKAYIMTLPANDENSVISTMAPLDEIPDL